MEFEKDNPITEEARVLAQTKKVVLQPADPFLKPEDAPDPIVMNETHANIERDSETTSGTTDKRQMASPTNHSLLKVIMIVTASLVAGVVAGVAYFIFIG